MHTDKILIMMCVSVFVFVCVSVEREKERERKREKMHVLVGVKFMASLILDKFSVTNNISRFLRVTQL